MPEFMAFVYDGDGVHFAQQVEAPDIVAARDLSLEGFDRSRVRSVVHTLDSWLSVEADLAKIPRCTGCGKCCTGQLCAVARARYGDTWSADPHCPLLIWSTVRGRYLCDLQLKSDPEARARLQKLLRVGVAKGLPRAGGCGCHDGKGATCRSGRT
jgi:hypothetical protein